MAKQAEKPDMIFETSWEVCNKVGGIYTVLSSRAQTLMEEYHDDLIFIGPDVWKGKDNPDFKEDKALLRTWRTTAHREGIDVRIGRWQVAGQPVAVLVDFEPLMEHKNEIYAYAWENFGVDSMQAYGDYDEASMFAFAAGRFVEIVYLRCLRKNVKVVYQAHEWMSGLGMLHLGKAAPSIATIFTTHATSIGRSITTNNKELYKYFYGYNGDQMAHELHMDAKHSVEKQSAHHADCFTTVSTFTDRECRQLLDKAADVILPNGFDGATVPAGSAFTAKRKAARQRLLRVAAALTGEQLPADTLILSTSGRNDYRCKGFDVFLEAMASLNDTLRRDALHPSRRILALLEVPCWMKQPRTDLAARLEKNGKYTTPLEMPYITHELYNTDEDRIVGTLRTLGLTDPTAPVKAVLIPCYLDGNDGIVGMDYYDLLTANDLCVYPSYYEPWGYTPLEACAYHTPCITTDLSGFGQWVNEILGHEATIDDGVEVIHRDDDNYGDVADTIARTTLRMLTATTAARTKMARAAARLADKAAWKNFIRYYYKAYDVAMAKK